MKANGIRDLFNSFESIAIEYSGIAAKAKDLVDEMTYINLSRRSINRQVDVIQEHIDNENAVRNMLLDRGICLNISNVTPAMMQAFNEKIFIVPPIM